MAQQVNIQVNIGKGAFWVGVHGDAKLLISVKTSDDNGNPTSVSGVLISAGIVIGGNVVSEAITSVDTDSDGTAETELVIQGSGEKIYEAWRNGARSFKLRVSVNVGEDSYEAEQEIPIQPPPRTELRLFVDGDEVSNGDTVLTMPNTYLRAVLTATSNQVTFGEDPSGKWRSTVTLRCVDSEGRETYKREIEYPEGFGTETTQAEVLKEATTALLGKTSETTCFATNTYYTKPDYSEVPYNGTETKTILVKLPEITVATTIEKVEPYK